MTYQKEDILVCMALQEEGGKKLEHAGAEVLYTGLGKVNATYQLTRALAAAKPKLVLNLGTAGSKLFRRGEIVACNRFIQRDMDVSPLGYKPFSTPFEKIPLVIKHKKIIQNLPYGTCGTGDSFETDHRHDRGEVVDMEAYALAKVCLLEKVDFACAKYISDGADEDASKHWQDSLKSTARLFLEVYDELISQ
jgi:adenosylhomocysteine nucleosidase